MAGDVEQKMKVFHVFELGSPLVPFAAFIFDVLSEHAITHGSSTSLERFYAFGCRRIANTEIAYVHRTVPERHYDVIKMAPRKRLQPGSNLHFAF